MRPINSLHIEKNAISVFCSGHSLEKLTKEDIDFIKEKSFLITMNYAPIKYIGDMLVWSDTDVTAWLNKHYKRKEKDQLFLTKGSAFCRDAKLPLKEMVDFMFDPAKFEGRFTLVWLLQILQEYFFDKKVFLFGLDMIVEDNPKKEKNYKWYDLYTRNDRILNKEYRVKSMLGLCAEQINKYINNTGMFINCNIKSCYDGFVKIDNWKEKMNELSDNFNVYR